MKHFSRISATVAILFLFISIVAQSKIAYNEKFGAEANNIWPGAEHIWIKHDNIIPAFIQFRNGSEPDEEMFFLGLKKIFQLPATYNFNLTDNEKDEIGWEHKRYQLTLNNVPVSNGIFIVHELNGKVKKYNGYLFKNISTSTVASISESNALTFALNDINADIYKWQIAGEERFLKTQTKNPAASYYPKGELSVLQIGDNSSNQFKLAWKFDVFAAEPLSRNYVYVDANTGEVLKKTSRICNSNANGTAITAYRGSRAIVADSYNGQYRLYETTRGQGIHTLNMQQGTNYGAAVEFLDGNNNWNNVNANQDQYAGDAHWGAEMTYDFYKSMGRNSIDDNGFFLTLYVHYDVGYLNAFWDGQEMNFGDGSSGYTPLTSLDITGHEISHGLDQFTANLDYQYESGALNESFSDIFGTAVEWFADSTRGNWLIGEDIGSAFRSMSDPKSYGDPNTYQGQYWYTGTYDNGGVHTNSNVQNFWDYILATGGSGTNDIGSTYNVTGITRHKATAIAWRNMVNYLTNAADYADSRFYSIQAATDLYGPCSQEVISTTKAWYAAGVGGDFIQGVHAQFSASPTSGCSAPLTVSFTNTSSNTNAYVWYFGDGSTSTASQPSHVYDSLGTYTVKLVVSGGTCGNDSITQTNYISISSNNACDVILPQSGSYQIQTACQGNVYDDGGPNGNYSDMSSSTVTISPAGAAKVKLHFTQFGMENGYDYLYVYDGPSTFSPLIGSYTGSNIPADITSSSPSITLRHSSDPFVNDVGYAIHWSCIAATVPPVADFKADVTQSCSGVIQFTDLSTGGANAWLWNFGDGSTSTEQNPEHTYISNNTYTVTLKATNSFGNNTATKNNYIVVSRPGAPSAANVSSCGPDSFSLSASTSNPVTWFDSSGNVISTANPFITPVLNTTTVYSVEDTVTQSTFTVGATSNQIGGGDNYNNPTRALRFTVNKYCTLESVYIYAQGSGHRTIQYRDTLGGIIAQRIVNCPNGPSRITLNIDLIPGGPYELGIGDTVDLYRNNGGAVYPYNDGDGMVSITGTNAGPSAPGYYYFFYNWFVKEKDCISQRKTVTATIHPALNAVSGSETDAICFGASTGSASISASGGTPDFTYKWSDNQTTATAVNLHAGNYTVTITDGAGCSATSSQTVGQAAKIVPATITTNVSCYNGNNGGITLTITGGHPNYTYNWGGGITSQNRSGLTPGIYTVVVTDSLGCTGTATTTITQPTVLNVSVSKTDEGCGSSFGSATANVSGGTPGYTYSWSDSVHNAYNPNLSIGVYTVTVIDSKNCKSTASTTINNTGALNITGNATGANCFGEATGSVSINISNGAQPFKYAWSNGDTTAIVTGLTAGNYSVIVTDSAGCSASISETIIQPTALNLSVVGYNSACNGHNGSVYAHVSGGTQNYSYLWNNSNTDSALLNIGAGTYHVTITDGHNCIATGSTIISNSLSLVVNKTLNNISCFGSSNGTAAVNVLSGTPPYHYLWNNGDTTTTINNLAPGNYTISIFDSVNCTSFDTVAITQPTILFVAVDTAQSDCNGGTATAVPSGGTSGYKYNWFNNSTASSISGLSTGNYSITVLDANSCSASTTFNVIAIPPISLAATETNVSCFGEQNGNAKIIATGGHAPYSYSWNTGALVDSVSGLAAGNYSVTITDNHNCTTSTNLFLSQPDEIQIATSSTDAIENQNNGTATVDNVYNAVSPYSYAWSNGDTTQTITNLGPGTYTVTITDYKGCEKTGSVLVNLVSGIGVVENEMSFNLHPNPAQSQVIIELTALKEGTTLNIKNVLGQSLTLQSISSTQTIVDLSPFGAGVYMVEIIRGEKQAVKKLVIAR